jgi:dihydroorotate dehydrogenase (NAD+) catalytic subunit
VAFSGEIVSNKDVPIIVSLVGSSVEDFPQLVNYFDSLNIKGYEINLSCPHVEKMGLDIGDDPEMVSKIVKTVKNYTKKPVIVKVGIGAVNVVELSKVAVKAGADIITAINTIRAMTIDVDSMTPVLGNKIGGLSGPAIKPIGVRVVYEITKNVKVPVIGCGGISTWRDVIEYMLAGASAVQFGSILGERDPNFFAKIGNSLIKYLQDKKSNSIMELVGLGCKS